jgi:hypothetical protein
MHCRSALGPRLDGRSFRPESLAKPRADKSRGSFLPALSAKGTTRPTPLLVKSIVADEVQVMSAFQLTPQDQRTDQYSER